MALMLLGRRIYAIFSVFGLSRSKNEEYTLCLACWAITLQERRICIVLSVFGLSRFKNEEYTLCLACLGYHASRTNCVKRVWAITL